MEWNQTNQPPLVKPTYKADVIKCQKSFQEATNSREAHAISNLRSEKIDRQCFNQRIKKKHLALLAKLLVVQTFGLENVFVRGMDFEKSDREKGQSGKRCKCGVGV